MKRIFTLLIGVVITISIVSSQNPPAPPQAFSYVATIVKNGAVVANKTVFLRVSILLNNSSGYPTYIEKFTTVTNSSGQINIEIGRGTPQNGDFAGIDWSLDKYFLKVEVDTKGNGVYSDVSNTQLLSVPYALYSGRASTATNVVETDPFYSTSVSHSITSGDITNWNNAFSWGPHAGLYKPINYTPTWSEITDTPNKLSGYGITDAMSTSHPANSITTENITNWNTAFGWGNHAGLYRPITYVPDWTEVTNKPTFATVATSGKYDDLLDAPVQLSEADVEGYIGNDVTVNFIPRGNGTKLVTGSIYDNGTSVGIGTTTPSANLDVVGYVRIGAQGNPFSEIRLITGMTPISGNSVIINYPQGYNMYNTLVLSCEVGYEIMSTMMYVNNGIYCWLGSNAIVLNYPDGLGYYQQPYKVLLIKF